MQRGRSRRLPAAGLVLANLVPLFGVFALEWSAATLLVGYWLEAGLVGILALCKVRRAAGADDPEALPETTMTHFVPSDATTPREFVGRPRRWLIAYVGSHFAVFWLLYGAFVVGIVGLEAISLEAVGPMVLALGGAHLLSYRLEYVGQRAFERIGPVTAVVEPYSRLAPIHAAVLVGYFAAGLTVVALVALVFAKTYLEVDAHLEERERGRLSAETRETT